MPGRNHRFTPTEDMLAKRIKQEYINRGYDGNEASRIGYATVTKLNTDKKFRNRVNSHMRRIRVGRKSFRY